MQVFYLVFSRNKIVSCATVSTPPEFSGDVQTKTAGSVLVSAYIRASSEEKAFEMARELVQAFGPVNQ